MGLRLDINVDKIFRNESKVKLQHDYPHTIFSNVENGIVRFVLSELLCFFTFLL